MQLGLIGKPNVGKSTFFKAATLRDVEIANYPFTTIKPNLGVTHVRVKCPHSELKINCNPRRGTCIDGTRFVPIDIYDVAGLVPGAHLGKGLGNKFLDDARRSKVLIMVVDATAKTDKEGNEGEGNPVEDVKFVLEEFDYWSANIIKKSINTKTKSTAEALEDGLSGLGIKRSHIESALKIKYPTGECLEFASILRKISKPLIIAANKSDSSDGTWLNKLKEMGYPVVPTSSVYEITLRKASEVGLIKYIPGASDFEIIKEINEKQKNALERIRIFLKKFGSTGVQEVLDYAAFTLSKMIPAFPVEDENKWMDGKGNILPDCILVEKGTTTKQLAYQIHTDIGNKFVKAIDGRTKKGLGANHEVEECAVIKISTRR